MYGVWRKTPLPHPDRRRKTMQTPKATALSCSLVKILKQKHPHKEKNTYCELKSQKEKVRKRGK
jgi:hypothetical protein